MTDERTPREIAEEIYGDKCFCGQWDTSDGFDDNRKCELCLWVDAIESERQRVRDLEAKVKELEAEKGALTELLREVVKEYAGYPSYGYTKEQCQLYERIRLNFLKTTGMK